MFNIVRILIGCIFFGISVVVIIKSKLKPKNVLYVTSIFASIALITLLEFIPFENLFVTFDSPEAAYEYYILGDSNIELVVEGNSCDFVVDCDADSNAYLIIPKTEDGWKVGIGSRTKKISQNFSNGISVDIYQYKNTNDYFITIFDMRGGISTIEDEYNTQFVSLEKYNASAEKTIIVYYAHIYDLESKYSVTVNGNTIVMERLR